MRSAQLVCVWLLCSLIIASAASECGGDPSCAAEKDGAALLQSKVQIQDAAADSFHEETKKAVCEDVTMEGRPNMCPGKIERGSDYYAKKCAKRTWIENKYCQKSCWRNGYGYAGDDCSQTSDDCSTKSKQECDAARNDWGMDTCTWTGSICSPGCSTFSDEKPASTKDDCPTYCMWAYAKLGNKQYKDEDYAAGWRCRDNYGSIAIGGAASQEIHYGKAIARPEYKTTTRYNKDTEKWEACGGMDNCWYGTDRDELKVKLTDATYTKAAVEVVLKCDGSSKVMVRSLKDKYNGWANLIMKYNLAEVTEESSPWEEVAWYNPGTDGQKLYSRTFPISSTDKNPILRFEVSRTGDNDASFEITPNVLYVKPAYDECMDAKEQHGQCLKKFSTASSALRSSPEKQKLCLMGSDITEEGCEVWSACLGDEGKNMILKVLNASDGTILLETASSGEDVGAWAPLACTEGVRGDGQCIDPEGLDPEAFDCKCYDFVLTSTPEQIRTAFCDDTSVCCTWKDEHCGPPPTLLQIENGDTQGQSQSIENTMSRRNLQNHSEDAVSLDDSLSGKRSCE